MTDRLVLGGVVDRSGADPAAMPAWIEELALDLEAGRITPDQAETTMRRRGVLIIKPIDAGTEPSSRKSTNPNPKCTAATIDPIATWRALPANIRREIGIAAVAATIADLGVCLAIEHGNPAARRAHHAAGAEATSLLRALVSVHVLPDGDDQVPPCPDLRGLGIRQCRACGCTDDFACEGGCDWIEADLCSACVRGTDV